MVMVLNYKAKTGVKGNKVTYIAKFLFLLFFKYLLGIFPDNRKNINPVFPVYFKILLGDFLGVSTFQTRPVIVRFYYSVS